MRDEENILDLLLEVDDRGRGLTEWEVGFVARLIDRDVKTFTAAQAARIKAIHAARVSEDSDEDDDF